LEKSRWAQVSDEMCRLISYNRPCAIDAFKTTGQPEQFELEPGRADRSHAARIISELTRRVARS
jgi:hypothetical protein